MSLIHWWPLNGNLNNKGTSNVSLTNNGATVNSAGKIGSCYNITGQHGCYLDTAMNCNVISGYSVTAWVKLDSVSGRQAIWSHNNGGPVNTSCEISSGKLHYYHYNQGWLSTLGNTTLLANVWYHVAYVIKNSQVTLYLNGAVDGSGAADIQSSYNGVTPCNVVGNAWGYNYPIKGNLNDVRIYDHALSVKEVKEISKGLVLHYTFEDEYIEPTTNLSSYSNIGGWNNSGAASYSQNDTNIGNVPCPDCKVLSITQTTAGQSAGTFGTTSSNIPSKTLTASVWFYMSGTHTGSNNIGPYIRSSKTDGNIGNLEYNGSTAFRNWPNNQWIKLTKTFTTNSEATTVYFCCYTANADEKFAFNGWQIEEKDHVTPWTKNGSPRSGEKVYDNSGYGNNGTITGLPQIVSTTVSGQHSIYFPANTVYIKLPTLNYSGFANTYTFSWWAKKTNMDGSMAWGFSDGNRLNLYPTGSVICWNTGDGANNPFKNNGSSITYSQWNNGWHLFTVTGNGTATKLYVDGQEVGTATTYKALTGTQIYISGWDTGTSYKWIGNIADYKIYSTALSAEDIKAEYNRKAAIDKNGNLFTGEIVEKDGLISPQIDKNNYIASNLFATTMELSDGSLWVPVCVHYIPDGLFSANSATYQYTGRNIWSNWGALSDLARPESGQWEFYVMQQTAADGAFSWFRFKQNKNPIGAAWADVNPSTVGTNVTRISASTTNNYAGMYRVNSSNEDMCFANGSNGNWYGAGVRAAYQGGIPGYNGQVVKGWQLVYMRVSSSKARLFKNMAIINRIEEL